MLEEEQKLHLGCGAVKFPGWINIDLESPTADRLLNLTEPLPFEDSSVSHIFNEHFIEHITREQAVAFLKECYRVLSVQGAIRISTPNLRYLINCYSNDNNTEWGDLWHPATRCQMMNEGMRSWGHQFVYDAEELTRVLGEAGFKSVAFQAYRQSGDDIFVGLETRPFHNELIIEARKLPGIYAEIDFSSITENETKWNTSGAIGMQSNEQNNIKTAIESAARAELIETQSARIQEIETKLAAEMQKNETLKAQLDDSELKLNAFRSSLCGRIRSFLNGAAE